MRSYEIKRGHWKKLEKGGLKKKLAENFGDITDNDDWHVASYGALKQITVRMVSKSEIELDTQLDPKAALEVATKTHQHYNTFLESITGFNAKQRADRAKAKAKAEAKAKAAAEQENDD